MPSYGLRAARLDDVDAVLAVEGNDVVGSRRVDAMVLEDNALGQGAWRALGYVPQPQWRRWVKALQRAGVGGPDRRRATSPIVRRPLGG